MAGEWLNALMSVPDAGQRTMQGFQQARQMKQQDELMRQQHEERQEDRQFRREDRQFQIEGREAEARKQQLEQARENIGVMARLLDGVAPENYHQRLEAARGMGLDVSNVPPQYDPNWVQQTQMQARALAGKIEQELMAVAPGTRVIDKSTGKEVYHNPRPPRYIPVQPGGKLVLDPSSVEGMGTPPSAGGDDDEWEYEQGGSGGNAGGGFPGSL